jgi:hypothetical protein
VHRETPQWLAVGRVSTLPSQGDTRDRMARSVTEAMSLAGCIGEHPGVGSAVD